MKVLVAGWIGSSNLGDELVFAGLRRLLEPRGVRIAAISRDPEHTRRTHGVAALSDRDPAGLLRAAGAADAVVFGGGGLLQDTTSPFNLPYHLSRVVAARLRGTPVAAVGLGAGALDTRLGRVQVRRVLRAVPGIAVRDVASQRLLVALGIPQARLAADLAFALAGPQVAAPPADDPARLVVCLRPWSGARGRLPAQLRSDTTPEPHVRAMAAALDAAARRTGLAVRFVALQADRDDDLHRRVAAQMRAPVSFATPTLDRVLAEIGAGTAVVSMRFHGGVAAVLSGRPVVLIDYAAKVGSLAGELGAGARLLPFDPPSFARLPAAIDEVIGGSADLVAGRARVLARQQGNARVLDQLLDRA